MIPWAELVEQGRKLVSGQNWQLGDLALEVATSYGEGSLDKFAKEIGVAHNTLQDYRRVAQAYPELLERSHNSTWSVYRVLAALDDRHKLIKAGMTVVDARRMVEDRKHAVEAAGPAGGTPSPGSRGTKEPTEPKEDVPPSREEKARERELKKRREDYYQETDAWLKTVTSFRTSREEKLRLADLLDRYVRKLRK